MHSFLTKLCPKSHSDNAIALSYNMPKYLQNQMQRVQNVTDIFGHPKFNNETDVF